MEIDSNFSDILIFGYWNIRGRGQQIRFLLEYCELEYKEVNFSFSNK